MRNCLPLIFVAGSCTSLSESLLPRPGAIRKCRLASVPHPKEDSLDLKEGSRDLLIVGCGTLGCLVGEAWRARFPDACVVGETFTDARHAELGKLGIIPSLRSDRENLLAGHSHVRPGRFSFVLFCAAPSKTGDRYPDEVEAAIRECWVGSESDDRNKRGAFVFTSSGGVYAEENGGIVTETSELSSSPRAARLCQAESRITPLGGCVLRLAGLYSLKRGAHVVWFKKQSLPTAGSGIINLLHYEDASSAAVAALLTQARGSVWLVSDDVPLTRAEICDAAQANPEYEAFDVPEFQGQEEARGKVYDTRKTRRAINWEPRIPSFKEFMRDTPR